MINNDWFVFPLEIEVYLLPQCEFVVFRFAQFKVLMEHLDPDEEDEEGEASASANIRNKAINALLGGSGPFSGPSPRNQAGPETDDDDSDGDERTPGVRWLDFFTF